MVRVRSKSLRIVFSIIEIVDKTREELMGKSKLSEYVIK